MIYLNLCCGLGNQLFQYAYARALSEEFNDPDIVINSYFRLYFKIYSKFINGSPEDAVNMVDYFVLNDNAREVSAPIGYIKGFGEFVPCCFMRLGIYDPKVTAEKYRKITSKGKFKLFEQEYTYYKHSHECKSKNKSVLGWFQSEKYFSKIRPILLKEFQFKTPLSSKNKEMADELSSCNSVCVHIRRGDLVNPMYSWYSMCNEDYYKEGMKYIAERTDNPVFYIFTNNHNDVEWIMQNYNFDFPVKYIDLGNPGYDDMRLMYSCKHFVISKSTFSWWGSYMAQSPGKIVVAPEIKMEKCWVKDKNNKDFYRDDMVKIHAVKENKK